MTLREIRLQKMRAEEKDIRALVQRHFSASLMNNTKWRKLANALQGLPVGCRFKFVDMADPVGISVFWSANSKYFDGGPFGPFLTLSIEWLDIDPRAAVQRGQLLAPDEVDYTAEVDRRLEQANVPYFKEGQCIRVVGHIRKPTS